MAGRVLEATPPFWVLAIVSAPVGGVAETIAATWGTAPVVTTGVVGALLALALALQFLTARCDPWIAATALVLVGAFAALVIDDLIVLVGGMPVVAVAVCSALLGVTLAVWSARDRTLLVAEIRTRRSEAFYWLAVLLAFGLGAAIGRLAVAALALDPVLSTALFAALISVVAVARIMFDVDRALCFWVALVLTRPLGAALGDLFAVSPRDGGLGVGRPVTSILVLMLIVAAVIAIALSLRRRRAAAPEMIVAAPEGSSS